MTTHTGDSDPIKLKVSLRVKIRDRVKLKVVVPFYRSMYKLYLDKIYKYTFIKIKESMIYWYVK